MNQLGTFIQVMTEKEAVKEGMEISGGIRFCKVEKIQGSYVGSLYIPSRAKNRSHTGFYFRIEKDKIIFERFFCYLYFFCTTTDDNEL